MAAWVTHIKSLGKEQLSFGPLPVELASHSSHQLAVLFPWASDVYGTSFWCYSCFRVSVRLELFFALEHRNGSSAASGWSSRLELADLKAFLLWFFFVLFLASERQLFGRELLPPSLLLVVTLQSWLLFVTRAHTHVSNRNKLILKAVFWEEPLCCFQVLKAFLTQKVHEDIYYSLPFLRTHIAVASDCCCFFFVVAAVCMCLDNMINF